MSARRRYAPVERLRRVLLVGLLVFLGVLLGVYLYQRARPAATPKPAAGGLPSQDRKVVLSGRGFEYALADGERTSFRIQAEGIVTDSENVVDLENVAVEVAGSGDHVYHATSLRARYERESSSASLEGEVRLSSTDGLELTTEALELAEEGEALVSRTPVTFRLGDGYQGSADTLRYALVSRELTLDGRVRISNRAPGPERGSLRCKRLVLIRPTGLVRAEGQVVLTRGASVLRARRLSMSYREASESLEFVRARWNVSGALRAVSSGDVGTAYQFEGRELSVRFDEAGEIRLAELEERAGQRVRLRAIEDGGLERQVESPYMQGDFVAGTPQVVRAYDGVEIRETLVAAGRWPLRRICARSALVGFDAAGEIEELVLQDDVELQEPGVQATGMRVQVAAASLGGRASLTGDPAWVRTSEGTFASPRIDYLSGEGKVDARGGVRAEMPPRRRLALIGEEPDEPVRVTAERAEWSESPAEFSFIDKVRVWQSESYLLANRVEGDQNGDRLRAIGRVKTVVRPEQGAEPQAAAGPAPADGEPAEDPAAGGGEAEPGALGGLEQLASRDEPIEVTASELTYERPERRIVYGGGVTAHQAGRTLKCATLDVELGESERFERLICAGDVRIENPERGHRVVGSEATYVPASGEIEIEGSPVVMTDRDGAQLRGARVLYDVDTGRARIRPRPPEPPAEAPQ